METATPTTGREPSRLPQGLVVVAGLTACLALLQIVFQAEHHRLYPWPLLTDIALIGYALRTLARARSAARGRSALGLHHLGALAALLAVAAASVILAQRSPWLMDRTTSISILCKLALVLSLAAILTNHADLSRRRTRWRAQRLNPTAVVTLSFAVAIAIGAALLSLPEATTGEALLSPVDALFTSTSATCVTGLIVKDTPRDFSTFGLVVIIVLIQAGGLGIMTLSTLLGALTGRRASLGEREIVREMLIARPAARPGRVAGEIVAFTLAVEAIGALVLALRWLGHGYDALTALRLGVFHAVSAFCNAGFSLFSDSLIGFVADPVINITVMGLIIVGGLGFPVVIDMRRYLALRRRRRRARLRLHSRVVLFTTAVLLLGGFVAFWAVEARATLAGAGPVKSFWACAFQSVTPRTAGFNTVPMESLRDATLMVLIALMFIGASPGSTGGGVKTATSAVVAVVLATMARGQQRAQLWGRAIPEESRHRAFAVATMLALLVAGITFLLTLAERQPFMELLFETVSALGTVGLSTGVTMRLTTAGRVLITVAMFIGRLGPLTVALAIPHRVSRAGLVYPDEEIMVG